MPKAPLDPEAFRRQKRRYSQAVERTLRDENARRGEDATRPAANRFFRDILGKLGRTYRRAADLGCNTGTFAREVLAPFCGRLLLVDFSGAALARARAALAERPAGTTACLQADLAADWPHVAAQGPFDLVSLCEVIQHMPEAVARERTFRNAAEALRAGGILLFSNYRAAAGEPREGFFASDKYDHLLYYWTALPQDVERLAAGAGLRILARGAADPVDAYVMEKTRKAARPARRDTSALREPARGTRDVIPPARQGSSASGRCPRPRAPGKTAPRRAPTPPAPDGATPPPRNNSGASPCR